MGTSAINLGYRQNSDTWLDFTESKKLWVKHDVTILNYDECKRLSEHLTADSRCQTAKCILYILVAVVGYCATIALGILSMGSIISFFVLELDMVDLGLGLGLTFYFGFTLLLSFQLWIPIFFRAIYFWEHASYITEQKNACADRMQLLIEQRA